MQQKLTDKISNKILALHLLTKINRAVGWDTRGENHEAMLQRRQPVNLSQASF
jgi:hypothetical protein